jgi:hypothetical protein
VSFPTPPQWLEAMEAAATEVMSIEGGALPEFEPSTAAPSAEMQGAYVSLMGSTLSVRLGIVAQRQALLQLTGIATMGVVAEDELQDATCELANVLAGNVRKFLSSRAPDLRMGLPLFADRQPSFDRYTVSCCELKVAGASALLLVMLPRSGDSADPSLA